MSRYFCFLNKLLLLRKRIVERIEDHTGMSISQSTKLGELKEIVSMRIALADRELRRVIGVENGITTR